MMDCENGRQVCSWRFPTWVGQDTCLARGELSWFLAPLTAEADRMADRAPEVPHALIRLMSMLSGDERGECPSVGPFCDPERLDPRPWYGEQYTMCGVMVRPRVWPERRPSEFDEEPDPLLEPQVCPAAIWKPVCKAGRFKYTCNVRFLWLPTVSCTGPTRCPARPS